MHPLVTLENRNTNMEKYDECASIIRIMQKDPDVAQPKRGLPNPGKRPDCAQFSAGLQRINEAYLQGNEVYSMDRVLPAEKKFFNSGNGSPLLQMPFPPAVQAMTELFRNPMISQYGYASGDEGCRQKVAEYLIKENIHVGEGGANVTKNHLIFFNSTTEAFTVLMQVLCRPGDVVLFTAPTYGLLAYAPERAGGMAEFLPLKEEDGWLINPDALRNKIMEINRDLAQCAVYPYKPCVTAFVNLNPHNPTGLVMGNSERSRLIAISDICKENEVFVIDDIIYRDLCYDSENRALPVASLPGAFSNTITMFGTSKCYGLAGARAGAVAADEVIIRSLRNRIFQMMDSMSLQVAYLMAGSFYSAEDRDSVCQQYFTPVVQAYKRNWELVHLLVNGNKAQADTLDKDTKELLHREFGNNMQHILADGIEGISIAGNIYPQSGFFCLLDFTALKGRRDPITGQSLDTEIQLLYYFFRTANVKLLTGNSFAWPNSEEFVARFSFAYTREDLVRMIRQIYDSIQQLE